MRSILADSSIQWIRQFGLAVVAWIGLVLSARPVVIADEIVGKRPAQKINIVFILADDLGWAETGCYGQKKIPTPNIDRLALEGIRLTQHYSGAPVCAPSRCVLMTGKHLGHAEIRGNLPAPKNFPQFDEGQHPLSDKAVTFPQLLQQAGYVTGAMGKWGLGPVGSTGEPARKGIGYFFGYNCQSIAHSYYPRHLWRNSEKIIINDKPIPGRLPADPNRTFPLFEGEVRMDDYIGKTHAPDLMINEAVKFLRDHSTENFFLYLPFIEPHMAMHPPKADVERFPIEWDDEPYRGESNYLPHPRPRAGYAAMISRLDGYVGRVLETLDDLKLAENTLVIFSSDNGATHPIGTNRFAVGGADPVFFQSTADLKGYKGSVYEGGIRVPGIARLPGKIPAGKTSDAPGYFADWFPTLFDAVGIETPSGLDGETLWPVLTGGKCPEERKPMVWVFPEYGGQVAIRIGRMKVVRQQLATKKPGEWEVYDIETDRGEVHDLSAERPDVIQKALSILRNEVDANPLFSVQIPELDPTDREAK